MEYIGLILDGNTYRGILSNFLKINLDENMIFIVFKEDYFRNFHNLKKEEKKRIFLSPEFKQKIIYYLCAKYDETGKKITLTKDCDDKFLDLFFRTLSIFFENDVSIIVPYKESLIEKGFSSPRYCGENICLSKRNNLLKNVPKEKELFKYEMAYMKSQETKDFCSITLCLDGETIDFLKNITIAGVTEDENGSTSQKEVFGKFDVIDIKIENGNITHTLKLDKASIIYGEDDNISAPPSLYNFHSHPFQAYLKYKTEFGVPSVSDFMAVYRLVKFYNTIVHFVASLEGLYIMSINPESKFLKEDDIKKIDNFFDENFDYEIGELKSTQEFIDKVNKFDFFRLRLILWKDLSSGKEISIKFNKVGKNCIIR